jgi:acetolactate synthase-1/2/3 large subunit
MNGAESLVRTAVAAGVDVCFTNPGTTEMPLVAALDAVPGMRGVLALFEGVVTGAADGYGRMAGRPALTLLHLGPGFANGIANLHNARRARSPVVNLIGDHATWQRNFDPPLASDIESLARPVSAWTRTSASPGQVGRDVADAIAASRRHPGRVATLIVPADCQWGESDGALHAVPSAPGALVGEDAVEAARRALTATGEGESLLLVGASGLRGSGLVAAGRIARKVGCRLACETFPARLERGPHLPAPERVPYFPEQAVDFLAGAKKVVLAGALDPVAFFGYPNAPSRFLPDDAQVVVLAAPTERTDLALENLADALEAGTDHDTPEHAPPPAPVGAISAATIAQAVASLQPEGAIVVDEGVTAAAAYFALSRTAAPHTYLSLTGGAIGLGMPCAAGAALACPDRKVIVLEGDGSGLYTVQALWTQARESLDVTNVVFANDAYRILQVELARAGVAEPGPQSAALTSLATPGIGWVDLARAFGVPASRVETAEDLHRALARSLAEPGPHLIEVRVP